MIEDRERDDVTSARWDLYQWFSSVLAKEQDKTSWEANTSEAFLEALAARAEQHGLEAEAGPLAEYLQGRQGEDAAETLMSLAVDYAQLFIGPGPGKAPPYESIYTSEEGRLYGDAYASLIETLHEEGIGVADDFSAPADHAAVELAVVAHLIERAAEGESDDGTIDATQAEFLETHLLNWMPRWCQDVTKHAETEFYRGVGRMLAAFLEREKARVAAGRAPA
jgi:TorA-specific chaperone